MKIGIEFELTLDWVIHQQKLNKIEDLHFIFEDKRYLFDCGSLYIMKTFNDVLGDFEDWDLIYNSDKKHLIISDLEHEILNLPIVLESFKNYVTNKIIDYVEDNTIDSYVEILNYN